MHKVILLPAYEPVGMVPEGGVPDGFSPEGGEPEGAVPFICIPVGGVPEGLVPFISIPPWRSPEWAVWFTCISAGGVPDGAADWSDDPDAACVEAGWGCSADAAGLVTADWAEELPESEVQPATKIPAMRIAEATNMMMMLLFMGYVSLLSGHLPDVTDLESCTATLVPGAGPVSEVIPPYYPAAT